MTDRLTPEREAEIRERALASDLPALLAELDAVRRERDALRRALAATGWAKLDAAEAAREVDRRLEAIESTAAFVGGYSPTPARRVQTATPTGQRWDIETTAGRWLGGVVMEHDSDGGVIVRDAKPPWPTTRAR